MELIQEAKELLKQYPVLAGAFGIYSAGLLTFILKDVPKRIYNFIERQFTVNVVLNNSSESFYHFLKWFQKHPKAKNCRTMVVSTKILTKDNGETIRKPSLNIGYGSHIFWYKLRPYLIKRVEKEAQNTKEVKESILIYTVGRKTEPIRKMIEEITPEEPKNTTKVYT